MLLNITNSKHIIKKTFDVKSVPVSDTLSFIEITKTFMDEGEESTEIFSGVGNLSDYNSSIKYDEDIYFENSYFFLTEDLKEFFQTYGYHYFLDDEIFVTSNGEVSIVGELFRKLKKEAIITFDKIEQNPDLIDSIFYCDYGNEVIHMVKDNKPFNSAMAIEHLSIVTQHILHYPDVIQTLIDNKKITFPFPLHIEVEQIEFEDFKSKSLLSKEQIKKSFDHHLSWNVGVGYLFMNAVINLTNEEYDTIYKHSIENDCHIRESLFLLDILGVSDSYYGYKDKNMEAERPWEEEEEEE